MLCTPLLCFGQHPSTCAAPPFRPPCVRTSPTQCALQRASSNTAAGSGAPKILCGKVTAAFIIIRSLAPPTSHAPAGMDLPIFRRATASSGRHQGARCAEPHTRIGAVSRPVGTRMTPHPQALLCDWRAGARRVSDCGMPSAAAGQVQRQRALCVPHGCRARASHPSFKQDAVHVVRSSSRPQP
jgi:hypothetical protein